MCSSGYAIMSINCRIQEIWWQNFQCVQNRDTWFTSRTHGFNCNEGCHHVNVYTVQFMQHTASKPFRAWFNIHPLSHLSSCTWAPIHRSHLTFLHCILSLEPRPSFQICISQLWREIGISPKLQDNLKQKALAWGYYILSLLIELC